MTALCKTGDNLLDKMRAEWEALEEMGLEPIAVCGDVTDLAQGNYVTSHTSRVNCATAMPTTALVPNV